MANSIIRCQHRQKNHENVMRTAIVSGAIAIEAMYIIYEGLAGRSFNSGLAVKFQAHSNLN